MTLAIPTDQDTLLKMLERRQPEYWAHFAHWHFCEKTYKGGREWFPLHIHKYMKEGDEEYRQRVHRCYRFNHTREVVDLIMKYIFKSDIARNDGDATDEVKAFWASATLNNLTIDAYMRLLGTMTSVFGRIWVWTDTNKDPSVVSKADQKASQARMYSYFLKPYDVLDYAYADDGSIEWVIVREYKRDDANPFTATGVVEERFRLWTKNQWVLFKIEQVKAGDAPPQTPYKMTNEVLNALGSDPVPSVTRDLAAEMTVQVVVVGEGSNQLGVVPGRPADHVIGESKYSAPGLIDDIAYLDKAVANYLSNLDAIIQDQTFSQLAMPAQGTTAGDDPYDKLREMGTKRIFTYDGDGNGKPMYLSPDVKQAQLIVDVINKIINEIYSTVGAAGERTKQDNSVGIDNSSGVAKAYDFDRLNSLLTTKSEAMCDVENWLVMMVDRWNGIKPDLVAAAEKPLVAYPDTFDVRSLYDEFTVAERLMLMDAPDLVRQEQMKQVIDKLFPALKEDLKKQMLADLKNWPMQDVTAQVTGTLTGNPSANFPGNAKVMVPSGSPMPSAPPQANPGPSTSGPAGGSRQGQVTKKTG